MNIEDRRAVIRETLAPYDIEVVYRGRGALIESFTFGPEADASATGEAYAALKRLAAEYRAAAETPEGIASNLNAAIGTIELAAHRVYVESTARATR